MSRQRRRSPPTRETSLYAPVKRFLETLGFDVKGEVCGCDLVALRADKPRSGRVSGARTIESPRWPLASLASAAGGDEPPVLQGINRTAACDEVWLAVRIAGRGGRENDPRVRKLCRFLGFGLLGVMATGRVEVLVEPGPWRPRRDPKRRSRLVNEHRRRLGDPVAGGCTKVPIMTAYRQQALACAASLLSGPRRTREIRVAIPDAPKIFLRNVYGWFARVERGVYTLTPEGTTALTRWPPPT
jgi:hypothetical protein